MYDIKISSKTPITTEVISFYFCVVLSWELVKKGHAIYLIRDILIQDMAAELERRFLMLALAKFVSKGYFSVSSRRKSQVQK